MRFLRKDSLLFLAGFGLGVYHLLIVSGLIPVSTMPMRLIHVMLAFSILFILKPMTPKLDGSPLNLAISLGLIAATVSASWWMLTRWKAIAFSGGLTEIGDFYAGAVLVAVVFEAARRGVGLILALITLVLFSYPFISPYLPGVLYGRGYSFERIVLFLTTDTQGIYGIPVGVAATHIIVFTIFGALLSGLGAGDFFFQVSVRLTRGMRAAGAKSAVVFSALIGMVSGSAAGNVAVTGVVTIPVMKREGYAAHQAGAIEAVASTGGQLMPPVMGAAAFIMATAILPALLFFGSAFAVVHLQGIKNGISVSTENQANDQTMRQVLFQGIPFLAAFGILITLMLRGYSPFKASL